MSPVPLFFFCYLFPGAFILAGTFALYHGLKEMLTARRSVGWPTAPGTIQSSGVKDQNDAIFDDVTYTYMVCDITYTSDRVLFADYGEKDVKHADQIASEYKAGQTVTVYYDPKNPSEAVLKPGFNSGGYVVPAVGSVFVLAGIFTLFFIPLVLSGSRPSTPLPEDKPVNLVNPVEK